MNEVLASVETALIFRHLEVVIAALLGRRTRDHLSEPTSCLPQAEMTAAAAVIQRMFKGMQREEIISMIDDESYTFINDAYPKTYLKEGVRSSFSKHLKKEKLKEEMKASIKKLLFS